MTVKAYLLSLPERFVRSALGLGAGVTREMGEIALPDGVRWLSASARVGATRTGYVFGGALLDHYGETLGEIRQVGYTTYAGRQLRPYVRAAASQFSPKRRTLTQRLLEKW